MIQIRKIEALFLFCCFAMCTGAQQKERFREESLPVHDRVTDLLSKLTVEEKISLLTATSPGIPRLGIPHYYHGN
jgi:beta-glucosidase